MFTKVKHFGVSNNIEKGRGSSLSETVSRFLAEIVLKTVSGECYHYDITTFGVLAWRWQGRSRKDSDVNRVFL